MERTMRNLSVEDRQNSPQLSQSQRKTIRTAEVWGAPEKRDGPQSTASNWNNVDEPTNGSPTTTYQDGGTLSSQPCIIGLSQPLKQKLSEHLHEDRPA
jgi:hypothetical protein